MRELFPSFERNVRGSQRNGLVFTRSRRLVDQRFGGQNGQSKTIFPSKRKENFLLIFSKIWNLSETPFSNSATLHGHQDAVLSLTVKDRTVLTGGADKSIFVKRKKKKSFCLRQIFEQFLSRRFRLGISIVSIEFLRSTLTPVKTKSIWTLSSFQRDFLSFRSGLRFDLAWKFIVQFITSMSQSLGHRTINVGQWNSNWRPKSMASSFDGPRQMYLRRLSTNDKSQRFCKSFSFSWRILFFVSKVFDTVNHRISFEFELPRDDSIYSLTYSDSLLFAGGASGMIYVGLKFSLLFLFVRSRLKFSFESKQI